MFSFATLIVFSVSGYLAALGWHGAVSIPNIAVYALIAVAVGCFAASMTFASKVEFKAPPVPPSGPTGPSGTKYGGDTYSAR
ncbi:MAG: hypothetical protein LBC41_04535 [Clostridiales bacterium]|nr:hypothetical protein [Clostridiales bacterium]MDR2749908.1 hypothetical protein [Clostridiales bacterium]